MNQNEGSGENVVEPPTEKPPAPVKQQSAGEKAFEKLDVKKNLGLDYYQFETHVRSFILDMVEPMLHKAENDHNIIQFLQNEYEIIKQRLETLSFETNKTLKKSVSQNEFQLRVAEIERTIQKSTETLHTDFKTMNTGFSVVKDKIAICQADIVQFNKQCNHMMSEFNKVYRHIDTQRGELMEENLKVKDELLNENESLKLHCGKIDEAIKSQKFTIDNHTQIIREYELKQNIFQSHIDEMFNQKSQEINEDMARQMQKFDKKMLKQRIETSDEVQVIVKNSREEALKAFRKEYNAKRMTKGTQASHLDKKNDIQTQVGGGITVNPPVYIPDIVYDEEWVKNRPLSAKKPRRGALPRTYTPIAKRKRCVYHLLPGRLCLTNSDTSSISPSMLQERAEDIEMRKLLEQKRDQEIKRQETMVAETAKAEAERALREIEEEQNRKREEQEQKRIEEEEEKRRILLAERGLEDMISEADKFEAQDLISVDMEIAKLEAEENKIQLHDPEERFLREEEDQVQKFYESLFPPEMKRFGMPDFGNFLQILKDHQFKPSGYVATLIPSPIIEPSELIFQSFGPQVQVTQGQTTPDINNNITEIKGSPVQGAFVRHSFGEKPQDSQVIDPMPPVTQRSLADWNFMLPGEKFPTPPQPLSLAGQQSHGQNQQLANPDQFAVFEYLQDSMMQLRDELSIKINDQLMAQDAKHQQILKRLHDNILKGENIESKSDHFHTSVGGLANMTSDSAKISNQGSVRASQDIMRQTSTQKMEMNFQQAIENATQITVDKYRHELMGNLSDQLRRAQARVMAHMRMENRSLHRLWILRVRREMLMWLSKSQAESNASNKYIKQIDERSRLCEKDQFDILGQVQRQVKILEDQFRDLREQQHKILFSNRNDEDNDSILEGGGSLLQAPQNADSNNPLEFTLKSANLRMLSPSNGGEFAQTWQAPQIITSLGIDGSLISSQQNSPQMIAAQTPQNYMVGGQQFMMSPQNVEIPRNNAQTMQKSSGNSKYQLQQQQYISSNQPSIKAVSDMTPSRVNRLNNAESQKSNTSKTNKGGQTSKNSANNLNEQPSFAALVALNGGAQSPYNADQNSPFQQPNSLLQNLDPHVTFHQSRQQNKESPPQMTINNQPTTIDTSQLQNQQVTTTLTKNDSNFSSMGGVVGGQQSPGPTIQILEQQTIQSPRSGAQDSGSNQQTINSTRKLERQNNNQKKASSPFRRPIPGQSDPTEVGASLNAQSLDASAGNASSLAPLKKAVFAIKGMNKFLGVDKDLEPPKSQVIVQQADPKIQESLNKQQKKLKNLDMQVLALVSQFKQMEQNFKDMQDVQIKELVASYVQSQMESLNVAKMKEDFNDFYGKIKTVENEMDEKMHQVKIMYEEVQGGFTKNARDRSDYLNNFERMTVMTEGAVNTFRENINEFQETLDKLSYCILSIVNEDEAAQLRLHKDGQTNNGHQSQRNTQRHNRSQSQNYQEGSGSIEDHARSSMMRVSVFPPQSMGGITGNGVSEVAAALEHELSQGSVPRRNGGDTTVRFKHLNDLTSEIKAAQSKNMSSIAFYQQQFNKEETIISPLKNASILPSLQLAANKTQNQIALGLNSSNTLQNTAEQKKNQSRLNYTDFIDQALVNSMQNTGLDMSNPQAYRAAYTNPVLRSSVNGVISHRIKNLIGAHHNMFNNYSQQIIDPIAHLQQMRMQAHSVIDYTGANGHLMNLTDENIHQPSKLLGSTKKKNQSLLREAGLGLGPGFQLNQNSKNEGINFDTLNRDMNKGSQLRGRSQLDRYQLKMHKFQSNLQVPHLQALTGANITQTENNPIMLHALIGSHTQSMTGSKEGGLMMQAASKKRKLMNEAQSKEAKGGATPMDPLSTRSVIDHSKLLGQTFLQDTQQLHSSSVLE